jgi:hypothetical protein
MTRHLVTSLPLFAILLANSAFGAFLNEFTGNSQTIDPDAGSDGVVNFSVYENIDNVNGTQDWTDDFGILVDAAIIPLSQENPGDNPTSSIGGLDTNATYVYFYQMVNTNPDTSAESRLGQFELTLPGGIDTITSAGFITSRVFNDPTDRADHPGSPDGATGPHLNGPLNNARLGLEDDTTAAPDDEAGDGEPSEKGINLAEATPFAFLVEADSPEFANYDGGNIVEFIWNPDIASSLYSTIFFVTSNFAPKYFPVETEDGGQASGDAPVPTPEPASMAMTLGALICGCAAVFARRYTSA